MSKGVTPEEFKEAFPQLANVFDVMTSAFDLHGIGFTGGVPVHVTLQDEEGDE